MADVSAGEKLKVFISYSRKDSAAFADELVGGATLDAATTPQQARDLASKVLVLRSLSSNAQEPAEVIIVGTSPEDWIVVGLPAVA
jgi:hypothetical protein